MTVRLDQETEGMTEQIIGSAFEVINELGHGFLEGVHQKALVHELGLRGLAVKEQVPFQVFYKDASVGSYFADIVVEDRVVIELKSAEKLIPAHVGQVLNYLRASDMSVGLLFNFGEPKLEFRRVLR